MASPGIPKRLSIPFTLLLILVTAPAFAATKPDNKSAKATGCSLDSVLVGTLCVDKYEASLWTFPATNTSILTRITLGNVTAADLLTAGATQLGAATGSCTGTEYPETFPRNGNWTAPLYALSLPGIVPSACVSWYQAAQACALVGKRLLRAEEWQVAAAGTPDPGDQDDGAVTCDVNGPGAAATGARTACVSTWGAFDMLGNLEELVSNWNEAGESCSDADAEFGEAQQCFGGDPIGKPVPHGIARGGSYLSGKNAAIFAIRDRMLEQQAPETGFRCARDVSVLRK